MKEEETGKLLNELAARTVEPVRTDLAEDIKQQIPARLVLHRGMDTVNIIIDLRIGKLAAAAVIIITMLLCANFLGTPRTADEGLIEESRMLVKWLLAGEDVGQEKVLEGMSKFYDYLVSQGKDVTFYRNVGPEDSNAVMMHWKISEDRYAVIFSNLREEKVTAEELVDLQARMLQKKKRQ